MPITIDLSDLASVLPQQHINNPDDLKKAVCTNITYAVGQLARNSQLRYTIDQPTLLRVLDEYLQDNPLHNNPFNILAKQEGEQWEVDYYNLTYGFSNGDLFPAQGKFEHVPLLQKKVLADGISNSPSCKVETGKFQYIPELKNMGLVDGTTTFANGQIEKGKRQYIPELKKMGLVDGTVKFPSGEEATGKQQYIPELKGMSLVDGTVKFPSGEEATGKQQYIPELKGMSLVDGTMHNAQGRLLKQGQWEYIEALRGMVLMQGLSVDSDGTQHKGRRAYIPELRGVVLA